MSGAPVYHVSILAVFAFGLAGYGAYASSQPQADPRFHLRRVAKANLLYLGLTGVVVLRCWGPRTTLARVYFILEAIVVVLLVRYEFRVFRRTAVD